MEFQEYFSVWDKLTASEQQLIGSHVTQRRVAKGTILHNGSIDCAGLFLLKAGQLRAYILSDEGRQITVYRLFDRDICLFSASCIMRSIQFEIVIEAEKDTELWVIPPDIYKQVMEQSAPVSNYTREIMESRFSDVMWLIEQVLWKSLDKRIAGFLWEESTIEGSLSLKITHEAVANHLGTHREVVTRMLRYFQEEGIVKLSRGVIEITDTKKLRSLQNS